MKTYEYNAMRRRQCREIVVSQFHLDLPIDELLFDDIETGKDSYAMLFRSNQDVYALLVSNAQEGQTLRDVRYRVNQIGLEAEKFFPPHANFQYFAEEGEKYFKRSFPGLKQWSDRDTEFYQSFADYSPALVRVSKINGEIRRYNAFDSAWQKVFELSFKKVRVQSI